MRVTTRRTTSTRPSVNHPLHKVVPLTQETRVQSLSDDVAGNIRLALCQSSLIGCHFTPETRVQSACDNVAGNIR